jgi:hypothetical protein
MANKLILHIIGSIASYFEFIEHNVNSIFMSGCIRFLKAPSRVIFIALLMNVLIFQETFLSEIANYIVEDELGFFRFNFVLNCFF